MYAPITILLMSLVAFAIGSVFPTLGQGVTGQRFVLPRTHAWTGDFSAMLKRRKLRLLVPYSKTLFFVDRGRQMGLVAEFGRALEASINARNKSKTFRLHVDLLPTARDQLFEALNKGYGDVIAANLTITLELLAVVDFIDPWLKNVKEIIVTGPSSPMFDTIQDLAGREIRVRESSVYVGHLAKLSDTFVNKGMKPIAVKPIDDNLENEDLIEMVNAGLLPYAVVDDHEATIWTEIFPNAIPRADLVVGEGGEIAWAVRKNSPELKAELNAFFGNHSAVTSFGATIRKRYFSGQALIDEYFRAMGVRELIDHELPRPGSAARYQPSVHVLPLILMLAGGGRTLEDLRVLRNGEGLRALLQLEDMPSSDATGDWLRPMGVQELSAGESESNGSAGLGCVNRSVFRRLLRQDDRKSYTLEIDATQIVAEKRDAHYTYKGEKGYMPMVGHIAKLGLVAGYEFREGNAAPAARNLEFMRACERDMPKGKKIAAVRADSAAYQAAIFNCCEETGRLFAIGADQDAAVKAPIKAIPKAIGRRSATEKSPRRFTA